MFQEAIRKIDSAFPCALAMPPPSKSHGPVGFNARDCQSESVSVCVCVCVCNQLTAVEVERSAAQTFARESCVLKKAEEDKITPFQRYTVSLGKVLISNGPPLMSPIKHWDWCIG